MGVCWGSRGIPRIVSIGGFTLKYMVKSGQNRPSALKKYSGRVLGLLWRPEKDLITMHLGVNLSPKRQKIRQGEELTMKTIGAIDHAPLTHRVMALQIHGLYDPLGLCAPITIKFKLLLQLIVLSKLGWDEPLLPELDKKARATLREIVRAKDIVFHRSTVPKGAQ